MEKSGEIRCLGEAHATPEGFPRGSGGRTRYFSHKYTTDALIYIATLLACSLLLELLARRRMAQQERMPTALFNAHPALGYTLSPGFRGRSNHGSEYRINCYGFRDFDGNLSQRPDGTRIVALDNSFAMAIGEPFDEPFLSLL